MNLKRNHFVLISIFSISAISIYMQMRTLPCSKILWSIQGTAYDVSLIDTVNLHQTEGIHGAGLYLGNHPFLAGDFIGRAIDVGITAEIPDSAYLDFPITGCDKSRRNRIPNGPYECNDSITGQMLEHRVAVPLKSRLPPLKIGQKYHMIFTLFPHDSVSLQVETRDHDDCRHIYHLPGMPGIPKTAIVGPCDCCTR